MRYPESLLKLTRALSRLPGIGPKTAQRLALHLAFHKEEAEALAEALEGIKRVRACRECGNLAEGELCPICQDEDRDRSSSPWWRAWPTCTPWSGAGSSGASTTSWEGP